MTVAEQMSDRDTPAKPSGPHRGTFARRTVMMAAVLIGSAATVSPSTVLGSACAGARNAVAATSRAALQHAVVCVVNQQRRHHGLVALREDGRLDRSAQGWTNTMVAHHVFSHGTNFARRLSSVGFRWSSAGENIATGFSTPAAVVRAWMASTGHCENILNPTYRYVGTGVSARGVGAYSGGGTWTQDFGLLAGQRPLSGDWGPARGCPY